MNLKTIKIIFSLILFAFISQNALSQKYTESELRGILDELSKTNPGFNNPVQINISGLPLSDFIYAIGIDNNVNLTVDPSLNQAVTYNFFDATVKDILVFIYINFELEYDFVGNILSVKRRIPTQKNIVQTPLKKLDIKYNTSNDFLSLNLQNDTLWKVTEEITKQSGKNIIIKPEIRNKKVNAFFQNRPFEQVIEMFVGANDLSFSKNEYDVYTFEPIVLNSSNSQNNSSTTKNIISKSNSNKLNSETIPDGLVIEKNKTGKLNLTANNVDLIDIIKLASKEVNAHYILHSTIDGKVNLVLQDVTLDELLRNLFMGSKYNFVVSDNIYIIGEKKMEGLRKTELIRMENRSIENVKTSIPKELTSDLEISEFLELNGLIVSGTEKGINELKNFLRVIDVVVPMVQIDVMILLSSKGTTLKTGMTAGLGTTPVTSTTGTIFPYLDVNTGAETINNLLKAISGYGFLNLGQVTENFYSSLSALETNNLIKIESTPKIATLNGQKASISIGDKTYYQETQVNVQTSVTQQGVLQSKIWKNIDANLTVNIQPFVSADEQITLTIKVNQDDFAGKVDPSSPPNMSTQTFESVVRVKNGEVILLGGLEKKKKNDSGSGVPFLSRIPVLKWLFSGRSKENSKSKLHILIKSTVTY